MSVTARLKETAAAVEGIPHCLGTPGTTPPIWKSRLPVVVRLGVPAWPVKPLPRVSAIRHGVTPMKGRGGVSESVVTPRVRGGVQVAGACQFAMVSAPRARVPRKNEAMARDERLVVGTENLLWV